MRATIGLLLVATAMVAQSRTDGPMLRGRHAASHGNMKIYNAAGSVRLIGWDRDSVAVRGRTHHEQFFFGGSDSAFKLGIDEHPDDTDQVPCDLVVYLPKGFTVSVKSVDAAIDGRDVSGWFYTVSGNVHLAGSARSLDVLSMSGRVDLDATTPFVRARAGDGLVRLRGQPEDVDLSTIAGAIDIDAPSIARGQFATVTGAISYRGAPGAGAIFDFSSHAGTVDLAIPRAASAKFTLSTVSGSIENSLTALRAATSASRSLTVDIGTSAARLTVRTFRGAIRLRPN